MIGFDIGRASIWLQGKGFEKKRSKAGGFNSYYYKYCFTIDGVKALHPHFVRLK